MKISQKTGAAQSSLADAQKQRAKVSKALANARQRCTNSNNPDHLSYGAKGIKVLVDVDELIDAIGYPADGLTLDRINPHGHYEVGNLRWATKAVQAANKKQSKTGSTLSIAALVAQQKALIASEVGREAVARAWSIMIGAWNAGYLPASRAETLLDDVKATGALTSSFDLNQVLDHQEEWGVFHLPALSLPGARVGGVGGPFPPCHQGDLTSSWIVSGLGIVNLDENLPVPARKAFRALMKEETSLGQTWIGQPSEQRLLSGWFDIWMLAAASSLSRRKTTAFRPVYQVLRHLPLIGPPSSWSLERDTVLDASVLFIPDLQLDCGSWGDLKPGEWTLLERLLEYRIENNHVTIVGVQNPLKLRPGLKKILMGQFDVWEGFETAPMIPAAKLPKFKPTYIELPSHLLTLRQLSEDPRGTHLFKSGRKQRRSGAPSMTGLLIAADYVVRSRASVAAPKAIYMSGALHHGR